MWSSIKGGKKSGNRKRQAKKEIETQKGTQERRLQKERERFELETSKAEICQAHAKKISEKESARRKRFESRVKLLENFRLRASRYADLKKKLHEKDYSQVCYM